MKFSPNFTWALVGKLRGVQFFLHIHRIMNIIGTQSLKTTLTYVGIKTLGTYFQTFHNTMGYNAMGCLIH